MQLAPLFLLQSVAVLITLGVVMLYSAVIHQESQLLLHKQICWIGLGAVLACGLYFLDYRRLARWTPVVLIGCSLLLLLVLVPGVGRDVYGARRWLMLGPVGFQPSEFAKLALILFVAWYAERNRRCMPTFWRGGCVPAMVCGGVLLLVFVEPDRGTTMLMCAVLAGMLLVAGVRWSMVLLPGIAGAAFLSFIIAIDPVRMGRVRAWIDPEAMKETTGYQVSQSLVALGSGGIGGTGLGDGRFKNGFLPLHQTDFIFSSLGEETGLLGTAGVLILFVVFIVAGIRIAMRARDTFGFLLASGITFLVGLQAFINIGVVTNTLPNKGLTLPFISYGGTSMLVLLASVGILLSIARLGKVSTGSFDFRNPFAAFGGGAAPDPSPVTAEPAPFRTAIACGGTGGHFFPGVAVAEAIVARGGSVRLLASRREVDRRAAAAAGDIPVEFLPSAGWVRGARLSFFRGLFSSGILSFRLFRSWRPQALLVMGGFTSVGPALAARVLRIPVWLHESNSVPGRANRILSRLSTGIFTGFAEAARSFPRCRVVVTGTPVRSGMTGPLPEGLRKRWGLAAAGPVLLVMGGSQGARTINQLMLEVAPLLARRHPDLQILHLTGCEDNAPWTGCYGRLGLNHCVLPFSAETPAMLRVAGAVLSRSGASSLAEFAAVRLPALLIPYPRAVEDHQKYNAEIFSDGGAAHWMEERELDPPVVARCLSRMLSDPAMRGSMREALALWDAVGAADRIAEELMAPKEARSPVQRTGIGSDPALGNANTA